MQEIYRSDLFDQLEQNGPNSVLSTIFLVNPIPVLFVDLPDPDLTSLHTQIHAQSKIFQ